MAQEYQEARPPTPNQESLGVATVSRPFTSAADVIEKGKGGKKKGKSDSKPAALVESPITRAPSSSLNLCTGSVVEVLLASNWGDPSYVGLTGISLLSAESRQPIALRPDQLTLSVPLEGGGVGEIKAPELTDGVNLTIDPAHMWAWPIADPTSKTVSLTFKLDAPTTIRGLRVWNYNQSLEDSYSGVRLNEVGH
jgi:hypothetical protein